eukprot:TRINITY_DN36972_c0_g1_i2.p2 TRINITY_DN36972_c0_g1~~TRINITY_DN36972_c0_g1_i2.p2  ORF type:complete len:211 (-),score=5.88 TRINITY_DN36972_c0_g1_i2:9-641(-)
MQKKKKIKNSDISNDFLPLGEMGEVNRFWTGFLQLLHDTEKKDGFNLSFIQRLFYIELDHSNNWLLDIAVAKGIYELVPAISDTLDGQKIVNPPNILGIHLRGQNGQVDKNFRFPEILDLSEFVRGLEKYNHNYQLTGVIIHQAGDRGHFNCYTRQYNNVWYLCDDGLVKEIPQERVFKKKKKKKKKKKIKKYYLLQIFFKIFFIFFFLI